VKKENKISFKKENKISFKKENKTLAPPFPKVDFQRWISKGLSNSALGAYGVPKGTPVKGGFIV
jgi:hypothetical protein